MIKLGVIGYGSRISNIVKAVRAHDPEFQVTGVVDPDESSARKRLPEADRDEAKFYPSLANLVKRGRPDALLVGTRCDLHARYAIAAAKTGLPLFLEKPIATTLRQARGIERAWRDAKAEVVVSFPLRVSHLCEEAKQRLDTGSVGPVEHLLATNYVPYGNVYFDRWYRDYRITGGLFLQKATHDFDYLSFLAGSPITRVAAMMSQGRVHQDKTLEPSGGNPDVAYYPEIGTPTTGMNEDSSSALLEFATGAKGVYTQVFYTRGKAAQRGVTVSGLHGTLQFDWYDNNLRVVPHAADTEPESYQPPEGLEHFGGDAVLAANFCDVVRGKARSKTPLRAGLQSVYACLAARKSAQTGRFVDVEQVTDL